MHPADEIRESKSNLLSNKKIVLGVTGSIAAVESIKLSRELIRHGANIYPVMTNAATKIIHPDALWFATGKKPIIELTGETEHVTLCGKVKNAADLLLISPCTANTISKISHGIDDTSVTTFATTAIGSNMPIMIVPAMHLSMYDHKIIQENIKKCKQNNISFIEPNIEKNKAKMSTVDEIVANVIRKTNQNDLAGKKILVIGGSTAEPIDDIRVVTNRSSGKTAIELAKKSFYRGAQVEIWAGWKQKDIPTYLENKKFTTIQILSDLVENEDLKKFDIIIICAAISDYKPRKKQGKIPSGKQKMTIPMYPTKKIISKIRELAPASKIVGFKVEDNKEKIVAKSKQLLEKNKLDFVIGNHISAFDKDKNEIFIISCDGKSFHQKGKKSYLADCILDKVK